MPLNHLYYHLKPYLPWRLRMAARRMLARRVRRAFRETWPINEAAAGPPEGWTGWPDGKQFAFVLTHDVEGPTGLVKCRQLMQLEMELGFRSSFNFVPEGDYAVSRELREELAGNGFEVGVHDLHHDGWLFWSRQVFSENGKWINCYLKEWGASGFRSGFMLRNLDWLHELNIQYDASTFDTDPFEPQPGGTGTIFPFWLPRPPKPAETHEGTSETNSFRLGSFVKHRRSSDGSDGLNLSSTSDGYIELPYTLPQDSTLFFLLQERSIEIWKRKLDWIAERGGMAMVIVHPDYLCFPDESPSSRTYPADFYTQLLKYIRNRYEGLYWQPLPRAVAKFCTSAGLKSGINDHQTRRVLVDHTRVNGVKRPTTPQAVHTGSALSAQTCALQKTPPEYRTDGAVLTVLRSENQPETLSERASHAGAYAARNALAGKRVAVVLFSYYPSDPRPRRAAEAFAEEGAEVDFLCLRRESTEAGRETINNINVLRVPLKRRRGRKLTYILRYAAFILNSFAVLTFRSLRKKYDLVHIHNMPDVLVFSALFPKVLGAKIILDLHDPMPELMMTIFSVRQASPAVKLLKLAEKWSIAFADLVLTPNIAFKNLFLSRSCPPEKIYTVMNTPNEEKFPFRPVTPSVSVRDPSKPFLILYHGSLVARHGLDVAVDALEIVRKSIPAVLVICGESTPYFEGVMNTVRQRGLQNAVTYLGIGNRQQIVKAIEQCDLGIVPNRRNVFTEINFPTRIFEYLALGKPVVVPRTRGIRDYFGDQDLIFFEPDDAVDLARKIEFVAVHAEEVRTVVECGQTIYKQHRWSQERTKLVELACGLLRQKS